MNPDVPPLPVRTMLMLAWATLVGLATGVAVTLALTDLESAGRLRHGFLACPSLTKESSGP